MKTLINITPGLWAKEIREALQIVYAHPDYWGVQRPGYILTLERDTVIGSITSIGKYDPLSPGNIQEAVKGVVDMDNNIAVVCGYGNLASRYHLEPTDKIYLTTP
jgi:hypothetical protein